jgi:hypothetical protein
MKFYSTLPIPKENIYYTFGVVDATNTVYTNSVALSPRANYTD